MSAPLSCPRCRTRLGSRAPGVEACASCGGRFVLGTLARTIDALAQLHPHDDHPGRASHAVGAPLSCPACAAPMKKHRVGLALEVDACEHGTWFDAGEIVRLQDAVARGLAAVAVDAAGTRAAKQTRAVAPRLQAARDGEVIVVPLEEAGGGGPTSPEEHAAEMRRAVALAQVTLMGEQHRLRMRGEALKRRGRFGLVPGLADELVRAGLRALLGG